MSSDINTVQDALRKDLKNDTITLVDVGGGGDCFFHCISDQVYGDPKYDYCVRQECVKYMESQRERYEPFFTRDINDKRDRGERETIDEHIENMKKPGWNGISSWAGDPEISACMELYQRPIYLFRYYPSDIIDIVNNLVSQYQLNNDTNRTELNKILENNQIPEPRDEIIDILIMIITSRENNYIVGNFLIQKRDENDNFKDKFPIFLRYIDQTHYQSIQINPDYTNNLIKPTDECIKINALKPKEPEPEPKEPEKGSGPTVPKSPDGKEKVKIKPIPKFNLPLDNTPITIPNSLVIYLITNVPGFQKIRFTPNMTDPKINKYVDTVYFDPIVKLNRVSINKSPKSLRKTQFYDKGLFFTLKNRSLSEYWFSNPVKDKGYTLEQQLTNAINNGTINNNITVTINTLFQENSVIYIDNKPYTIYSCKTIPGDWKIDTNTNLPGYLSTGQYFGPYSNYQGGPASPSALTTHPMERFRQPTIYITNNSSGQSTPQQIENAEKQLNSIPKKLITGPTYNKKEFSNIGTIHQPDWRMLPSGNKPLTLTAPVDYNRVAELRYNPNLPQNLAITQSNNPLINPYTGMYNPQFLTNPNTSPYYSNSGLLPLGMPGGPSARGRLPPPGGPRGLLGSYYNPFYIQNRPLYIQNGGASAQTNIRNFFSDFYNNINSLYKNMTNEEKAYYEYTSSITRQLPYNLRKQEYDCNPKTLSNIFIEDIAGSDNDSYLACIAKGIQNYNSNVNNKDNLIVGRNNSPGETNIDDRIVPSSTTTGVDEDNIKLAIYYYFMDHPDEYNKYINDYIIENKVKDLNDIFENIIKNNSNTLPASEEDYNNILETITITTELNPYEFGIKTPSFEEYKKIPNTDFKKVGPFELVTLNIKSGDESPKFKSYVTSISTTILASRKITEIIRKKYGIKVIIIGKTPENTYDIMNCGEALITPENNNKYPDWSKYMFLLHEKNRFYLLNFITRNTYTCANTTEKNYPDKLTKTSIFLRNQENDIMNQPPVYIIFFLFIKCFIEMYINEPEPKINLMGRIDLFKIDFQIFSQTMISITDPNDEDKVRIQKEMEMYETNKQRLEECKKIKNDMDTKYNDAFKEEKRRKDRIILIKEYVDYLNNDFLINSPDIASDEYEKIKDDYDDLNKRYSDLLTGSTGGNTLLNTNQKNPIFDLLDFNDGNTNNGKKFLERLKDIKKKYIHINELLSEDEKIKYDEALSCIQNFSEYVKEGNILKLNDTFKIWIKNLIKSITGGDFDSLIDSFKKNKTILKPGSKKEAKEREDGDGEGEGGDEGGDEDDGEGDGEDAGGDEGSGSPGPRGKGVAPPPGGGPPPPLDELDRLNDELKKNILGAWEEVSYKGDPSKKYWWNKITNETTDIGAPKPTGLTATTPVPEFMSYDSQFKENSNTSFIIFVNLVLYPGTTIPASERRKLACYLNYEEIRRSYAELMGYEYIPIPMSDDKYYKLDNNKTEQTQPSITSQNPTISQKNTTSKRVTFDNNPPQRFRGGKNNTKRNRHR
jgi:ribosomal protein L12E/L44/L45/RPP1/RPP2